MLPWVAPTPIPAPLRLSFDRHIGGRCGIVFACHHMAYRVLVVTLWHMLVYTCHFVTSQSSILSSPCGVVLQSCSRAVILSSRCDISSRCNLVINVGAYRRAVISRHHIVASLSSRRSTSSRRLATSCNLVISQRCNLSPSCCGISCRPATVSCNLVVAS